MPFHEYTKEASHLDHMREDGNIIYGPLCDVVG